MMNDLATRRPLSHNAVHEFGRSDYDGWAGAEEFRGDGSGRAPLIADPDWFQVDGVPALLVGGRGRIELHICATEDEGEGVQWRLIFPSRWSQQAARALMVEVLGSCASAADLLAFGFEKLC